MKFLKEISEALSTVAKFRNAVEKEFGKRLNAYEVTMKKNMSDDFFQYCDQHGNSKQMACPNTPQQNDVSEKKLAHIVSISLPWPHDKNLPRELWTEAFQCVCYVINHLPPWSGKEKSPFELLYDVKPNVNHFWVFGSISYVHVPKSN